MIKKLHQPSLFNPVSSIHAKKYKTIFAFASQSTKKKLAESFSRTEREETLLDVEKLRAIWKSLLIDALHFLRINDCRERAYLHKPQEKWQDKNKTTMSLRAAKAAALNAFGIEDLFKYFEQYTAFEGTLYGSLFNYRDHVQHPIYVWLLGLHILMESGKHFSFVVDKNKDKAVYVRNASFASPHWETFQFERKANCIEAGNHDCEACGSKKKCQWDLSKDKKEMILEVSLAEFAAMWTIVALTHDLGYPLEKVERVNDRIEMMMKQFGNAGFTRSTFVFQSHHDHLIRFLLRLISSRAECVGGNKWCTHVSPKYLSKFSSSWEKFDHGIVSSLILLRSLIFFLESDISPDPNHELSNEDTRQFCIRSEILHAMAAHTSPKIYHLSANTLSFLLILCDDLHEWGRPTMMNLRQGKNKGSETKVTLNSCKIKQRKSEIRCQIVFEDERSHENQFEYCMATFKRWHERLRPAVFDTSREMVFEWIIEFPSTPHGQWKLVLDTNQKVFSQVSIVGPSKDFSRYIEYKLYSTYSRIL